MNKNITPFSETGQWYKGNLHTHTQFSDGKLSLEDVIRFYKNNGYHFLAITDHNRITDIAQHQSKELLLIPSIEWNTDKTELGTTYHLLGINIMPDTILPENIDTIEVQTVIDFLRGRGAEVFLNHPYWSGLTIDNTKKLNNYLGIEVFNFNCQVGIGKGLASVHWDDLLARNKQCFAIATDDAHFLLPDAGGAWIMLKANNLTKTEIMNSLRTGKFYATTGPEIQNIVMDGNIIKVFCSPVVTINFISNIYHGGTVSSDKKEFNSAEFKLSGNEIYIRVECIDKNGKTAWSNPIYFGS